MGRTLGMLGWKRHQPCYTTTTIPRRDLGNHHLLQNTLEKSINKSSSGNETVTDRTIVAVGATYGTSVITIGVIFPLWIRLIYSYIS